MNTTGTEQTWHLDWNATPKARWDRFMAEAGAALQQDWAFGTAMEAHGSGLLRVEVRRPPTSQPKGVGSKRRSLRPGKTVAMAQFTVRDVAGLAHWALCTRGPVWAADVSADERAAIFRAMKREAPLRRVRAMFFTPDVAPGTPLNMSDVGEAPELAASGLRQVMTGYSTVMLDLGTSLDDLRRCLHQKWRNRLVAGERALRDDAVSVREAVASAPDYRWLLEAEAEQQNTRRYQGHPPSLTPAYQLASQRSGSVRLFDAKTSDERCAAMLFLVHGRAATYHIGWSNEAGRRTGAHNLLLWRAMAALKKDGIRTLDLGGVETETAPGVARFKLGTGGKAVTLAGTYF